MSVAAAERKLDLGLPEGGRGADAGGRSAFGTTEGGTPKKSVGLTETARPAAVNTGAARRDGPLPGQGAGTGGSPLEGGGIARADPFQKRVDGGAAVIGAQGSTAEAAGVQQNGSDVVRPARRTFVGGLVPDVRMPGPSGRQARPPAARPGR
jgi:hypothetical protein